MTAWKRCVGQEEPEEGFLRQADWAANGVAAQDFRVAANVHTGNQTPTSQKTASLELFVPLLFWYNKDIRLAVPSVAIPYGQRFINIELATAAELVGLVPRGTGTWLLPNGTLSDPVLSQVELYINNIFVNPEVHRIYIKRVGFSLIRVHRQQLFTLNSGEGDLHLQQLKWPIEYLFVGAKQKDYFAGSATNPLAKYLDVWDRYGVYSDQTYLPAVVMTPFVTLTTTGLMAGVSANTLGCAVGVTAGVAVALTGDSMLTEDLVSGDLVIIGGVRFIVSTGALAGAVVTGVTVINEDGTLTVAQTASAAKATAARLRQSQVGSVVTKRWAPSLETININAHSIDIYKEFPVGFFNAYTGYHYGGPNVNASQDVGALFIPFCIYPGTYQPSGHINVSRAREFYVKYKCPTLVPFSTSNLGLLVVIASAINFLLISDGSAVLRYST